MLQVAHLALRAALSVCSVVGECVGEPGVADAPSGCHRRDRRWFADPPTEIVEQFAGCTLLVAERNRGPYRLIQQVIADTDYDGYLFQDADDWSAHDRLEQLLRAAARTGADLVGCQEGRWAAGQLSTCCLFPDRCQPRPGRRAGACPFASDKSRLPRFCVALRGLRDWVAVFR